MTPRQINWAIATAKSGIRGPAIQFSQSLGGTSGRFQVAEIAALVFPSASGFVNHVEAEGLLDKPFPRGPYPADRLTRLGEFKVRFTTPPHKNGFGTSSRLAPGPLPIDGVVVFDPKDDVSLDMGTVRLPPTLRWMTTSILSEMAAPHSRGTAP